MAAAFPYSLPFWSSSFRYFHGFVWRIIRAVGRYERLLVAEE
jgi:hypothetical protein